MRNLYRLGIFQLVILSLTISCTNQNSKNENSGEQALRETQKVYYHGPEIALIGQKATIEDLEDDAQAAANWVRSVYGENSIYLAADNINRSSIQNLKVLFYYELNAPDSATTEQKAKVDLGMMKNDSVVVAISDWVKNGGNLLLAGDASDYIFDIGRVPKTYGYGEKYYGHLGAEDKPSYDIWGLSVVDYTNSQNRTGHSIFKNILTEDNRVQLCNAARREVRLVWWNLGPAGGDCCNDVEMITRFEDQLNAIKLASLYHINDYFGIAAFELKPTIGEVDPTFSADISKDFKGTVIVFSNSIIGYEWAPNGGSVNDYQKNIEMLTKNAIDYLMRISHSKKLM